MMLQKWIGKQVARYEHAAKRAQMPIWIVIAINTTLEIIYDTVPWFVAASIYVAGIFGAIIIGYISDKTRLGVEVSRATWGIDNRELWNDLSWTNNARIAYCLHLEPAKLAELRAKHEKRLGIWEADE
jgi:hypothetical protein